LTIIQWDTDDILVNLIDDSNSYLNNRKLSLIFKLMARYSRLFNLLIFPA